MAPQTRWPFSAPPSLGLLNLCSELLGSKSGNFFQIGLSEHRLKQRDNDDGSLHNATAVAKFTSECI
jgi:hypothetical protein